MTAEPQHPDLVSFDFQVEVNFALREEYDRRVDAWAEEHLIGDPNGQPQGILAALRDGEDPLAGV